MFDDAYSFPTVAKQPTYNTCIQQGGRKTVSGLEIEVLEVAADWIQNDDPAKADTPIHEILVTTDKPWWGDFLVAVPLFFTTLAGVFLGTGISLYTQRDAASPPSPRL